MRGNEMEKMFAVVLTTKFLIPMRGNEFMSLIL